MSMEWDHPSESYSTEYVIPVIYSWCEKYSSAGSKSQTKLFDIGCGNGALTKRLFDAGFSQIVGMDASKSGIELARKHIPGVEFFLFDLRDDPPSEMLG